MSDPAIATALLLGGFVLLMILRVPITYSLRRLPLSPPYLKIPLMAIVQQMVQGVRSFSLLAIPFFIIAGEMMGQGGIARKLIELANIFVGRIRGGLAMVNCVDSMFFGGISGSAVADVASTGTIIIPMMKMKGYDEDFASPDGGKLHPGVTSPSLNMKIYSLRRAGCRWGDSFWRDIFPASRTALDDGNLLIIAKSATIPGRGVSFKGALKIFKDAAWGS